MRADVNLVCPRYRVGGAVQPKGQLVAVRRGQQSVRKGYYGAPGTWDKVKAHYKAEVGALRLPESYTKHAETPKTYFEFACAFTFENSCSDGSEYYVFYQARLLQQVEATGKPSMQYVPPYLTRYVEIAKAAVQQPENRYSEQQSNAYYLDFVLHEVTWKSAAARRDSNELQHVERGIPAYVDIAKLAVGSDAYALGHVRYGCVGYDEIAKVAVARRGSALYLVDTRAAPTTSRLPRLPCMNLARRCVWWTVTTPSTARLQWLPRGRTAWCWSTCTRTGKSRLF